MHTLESLIVLVKTAVKVRCLQISKILKTDTKDFFQYLSGLYMYLWGIHSFKSNSALSRSSYLYGANRKFSLSNAFFLIKSLTRNFMLNTMMENGNKFFANISISFLILFIMKLIAQIKILFFSKLKVLFWNI